MARTTRETRQTTRPARSSRPSDRAPRIMGGTAGLLIVAGALTVLAAVVAMPGSWLRGYVSEAGSAEQPLALAYRGGFVLLALGTGLLGLAVRRPAGTGLATTGLASTSAAGTNPAGSGPAGSGPAGTNPARTCPARSGPAGTGLARTSIGRFAGMVGALLVGAGALAAISGSVPCSRQCPLPPFEPTTVSDVVHATASIIGVVVLTAAMVIVALSPAWRPAARRLAIAAAGLTIPLGGAIGLLMLLVGRSQIGAVLERLLLAVAVGWLIGMTLLTILRPYVKLETCNRTNPLTSNSASQSSSVSSPS